MLTAACCTIDLDMEERFAPMHKGVDLELKPYVDEYFALAKLHNVTFKHTITMGFTDIKVNDTVGITHYGYGFREIDIDRAYWKNASATTRRTILQHELSHGYCSRPHDWAQDKHYQDPEETSKGKHATFKDTKDGMLNDGCPKTILYPYIVNDICVKTHYAEYTDEMFQRCKAF